ncbi:CLUMA_CG017209, isoform A [Clunio marinus]|uniref:CLUMA_CG017209, isoform A n=1 Tax=Clunio marinus TaxID=568069 RepID=A0A1J1IVG9_9DIPT|nr:CLUMA_CG017209, isoform A [Clunio marinus]
MKKHLVVCPLNVRKFLMLLLPPSNFEKFLSGFVKKQKKNLVNRAQKGKKLSRMALRLIEKQCMYLEHFMLKEKN